MPRTKKVGRPKLKAKERKHNFTIRLADHERELLEVKFKTVQNAVEHLLFKEKQNAMPQFTQK